MTAVDVLESVLGLSPPSSSIYSCKKKKKRCQQPKHQNQGFKNPQNQRVRSRRLCLMTHVTQSVSTAKIEPEKIKKIKRKEPPVTGRLPKTGSDSSTALKRLFFVLYKCLVFIQSVSLCLCTSCSNAPSSI